MWFLVRFFNKNQKTLASRDKAIDPLIGDILKSNGEWHASIVDAHINTSKYMIASYILKEQFILYFFLEYWKVRRSENEYVDPKKFPHHAEKLKYVNAILVNCMLKNYDFLRYGNGKDEKRLYITGKGEHFSAFPIGLFREWIIYIGPIWTTAGVLITWLVSYLYQHFLILHNS